MTRHLPMTTSGKTAAPGSLRRPRSHRTRAARSFAPRGDKAWRRRRARPVRRRRHVHQGSFPPRRSPRGFTLVEIMVALVLTLVMMSMAAGMFTMISESVRGSRALVEASDRQRAAQRRLDTDLSSLTAAMLPPLRPDSGEGYLEYIEGPQGAAFSTYLPGLPNSPIVDPDRDGIGRPDTTYADCDDILMFTIRSKGDPYVGRFNYKRDPSPGQTPDGTDAVGPYVYQSIAVESRVAEVAWFVRGNTLYRRILLVLPGFLPDTDVRSPTFPDPLPVVSGFYGGYDISVHQEGGALDRTYLTSGTLPVRLVPNSLADLTRRQYRFGHQPCTFPHDVSFWGDLRLPTLRECSSPLWPFPLYEPLPSGTLVQSTYYSTDPYSQLIVPFGATGTALPLNAAQRVTLTLPPATVFDAWSYPYPWAETNNINGTLAHYNPTGFRIAEDVMLTNVIGFDVKAFDPGAPLIANAASNGNVVAPGDPGYLGALRAVPSGTGAPPGDVVGFGAYVDLGFYPDSPPAPPNIPAVAYPLSGYAVPQPHFRSLGDPRSRLERVYDTWSFSYEHDGLDQDDYVDSNSNNYRDPGEPPVSPPVIDEGADGLDNDGVAGADDENELEAPPPYRRPLRGLQVKIRIFEPDTRQVREVTVVKSFVSE